MNITKKIYRFTPNGLVLWILAVANVQPETALFVPSWARLDRRKCNFH
ncbi:MAG: hypothetical protein PHP93_09345 [Kiritimatiellales bacterium]|nr:hypothetical protein [Kiritimatiellales bacterium]